MRRNRYVIFSIAVIMATLSTNLYGVPNEVFEGYLSPMNMDGPSATLSVPWESGLCSACSLQGFTITFSPSETVVGSTITFDINDTGYSTADSDVVTFEAYSGNLVFNPTAPWPDGTIVHVDSVCACDIHGNWSINALEFTYHIDLSPPVVSDLTPSDGDIVLNLQPTISFVVSDSGCSALG